MYDIIIIGAGPAGLTAAIYAGRSGKSALLLEEKNYGGQIVNTPDIENYPGISHISGVEYAMELFKQAESFGADIAYERALDIFEVAKDSLGDAPSEVKDTFDQGKRILGVKTSKGVRYAKAVVIATGAKNRKLGLENEDYLVGRGVSYCATCDGMFYRDKVVAVNGGGNTAVEDALFLANYCKKVYIVHRRDEFRADKKDVEKLKGKDNIELVLDSTIKEIKADEMVNSIVVLNKKTSEEREIAIDGLFVAIGQEPDNKAFEHIIELEKGYVKAGEDCKTKMPGVYVAGDCRTKEVRQLATAAADGAIAALAACAYID